MESEPVQALALEFVLEKIARSDQRIAEGRRRLGKQLRLIAQMAATGSDTTLAQALAREIARGLRTMRTSRALCFAQSRPLRTTRPGGMVTLGP